LHSRFCTAPDLHRTGSAPNLDGDEKKVAGPAMHYAMGMVSDGIYGVSPATVGFGSIFGTIVWAVADEWVLPKLALSKKPEAGCACQGAGGACR
jgi:hypothetical protein